MHFDVGWISVFILVALINLYLIYHYFIIPFKSHKKIKRGILFIVHALLMGSSLFYFSRFFYCQTQTPLMDFLMYVAGIYLCMLFYSVAFFFIYDILRIINHFKKFPKKLREGAGKFFYGGLTVFIICALITAWGFYPAKHIVVTDYEATVPKKSSTLKELRVAMISDAHIGVTIKEKQIIEIKEKIMDLNPDMIVLAGDMFDEGTTDELKITAAREWSEMAAPYGVYFVLGNHDDYTGYTEKQIKYFSNAGITVLRNKGVSVEDLFYVAGRDDFNQTREPYEVIEKQITKDLPVIVVDHRPEYEEVSKSEKADIQLSGHTHNGQVFPIQTADIFDYALNYGIHNRGNCQVLVSSGVGNYGIPIRIGSPCEIVNLKIRFD